MIRANEKELFNSLLSPLKAADFFETYHEKTFYHITDRANDFYDDLLTLEDIDACLQLEKLPSTSVRLVKQGKVLADENWRKGKGKQIDAAKIFEEIQDGSSLILEEFDHHISKLHQFVTRLKAELNALLWTNIYITPSSSKAFKRHYDNHDVFILQLNGTKDWKLYETVAELPDVSLEKAAINYEKLEAIKELRLEAGDLLYVPRGMVHEAITTDTTSVHITLGMKMPRMKDVLNRIQAKAVEQLFFRKNITNALQDAGDMSMLKQQFQESIADVLATQSFEEWVRQTESDFYNRHFKKSPSNGLHNLIQLDTLHEESRLQLRPDGIYTSYQEGMFFCVELNGKKKQFPLPLKDTIVHIFSGKPFQIKEIEGAAPMKYKLKLVKDLVSDHWLDVISKASKY